MLLKFVVVFQCLLASENINIKESNELNREMIENRVSKLDDKQAHNKGAFVYGHKNENPRACGCVCVTGLIMAGHFHEIKVQDVLLFIDNIFFILFKQTQKCILLVISLKLIQSE